MQNKRQHVSQIQKNHLLRYIQKNPRLAYHKFSSSFSVNDARKEWISLATSINSLRLPGRGSVKSWKQWRKTWQDLKSKTKIKFLQGNDALTREEKLIFKICGGFGDNQQLLSNGVLKSETDESGIDSDEYIRTSDAIHYKQENLEDKDTHENIIIHVVESDESHNMSHVKTKYLAANQNTEAEEEVNDRKSDVTENFTTDQYSDNVEPDFVASYREKKLMYLRRIARANEISANANERIADALERIASAGESII